MKEQINLKRCPFCGGKARIYTVRYTYGVECRKCYVQTIKYGTPEEVIAAWNRRANNDDAD